MFAASLNNTPATPVQNDDSSSQTAQPNLSAACALLALMLQSQSTTQSSSKTDVQFDFEKMDELKKQLADAVQQAKDAADSSGFFGFLGNIFGSDVAEIAGAVAAVAAVVASGGTAAPLLVVILAEGLQAAAKLGPKLGLDPNVCMALSIASVAVGFAAGTGEAQAAGLLAGAAHDVEAGAEVVQSASVASGGVLHLVSSHYQAQSLGFRADATGYQAKNDATSLDLDDALSLLQRALQTQQRETQTVSGIVRNDNDSNVALCGRI